MKNEIEHIGTDGSSAMDGCIADTNMRADVFEAEQAHLSTTHAQLEEMAAGLVQRMCKLDEQVAADKDSMTDDIARNYASDEEAMEMHVDMAMVNSVIDSYNLQQDANTERLRNIRTLLLEPYFAKVALRFKPDEQPKELYIGKAGISDDNYRRMVVDWRSPVAEVYYNQDLGPTSYRANGRTITADLTLRRQFDIEGATLKAYFDSDVAIQDSLLLASLNRQRSAHMQDITATIQKEQNLVVRHEDVPALLVSGIAGSGKTSVLMQRIAYLFFQQRETLDPSQVYLITPNPVFGRYVASVLPDLGERNPEIVTWEALLSGLLPEDRGLGRATHKGAEGTGTTLNDLRAIDEALVGLEFRPEDYRDIVCQGEKLITAQQVRSVAGRFKRAEAGPHRATLIREELIERLDARIRQLAATDEVADEIASLTMDEQIAWFGELVDMTDEDNTRVQALTYLRKKFAAATDMVLRDEWLNVDRIGMRLLGNAGLDSLEWLYLKMGCTGLGMPDIRYVMIDEVQDYSAAQLAVIARYFPRAHFMLLGDPHQAIDEGRASFDDLRTVFRAAVGEVVDCSLMTSYRSTPEITNLFASLLPDSERGQVQSIQREQDAPRFVECKTQEEYVAELRAVVSEAAQLEGTTAVVAAHKQQVRWLQGILGDDAPELIGADQAIPSQGVCMITLRMAKGLEFDGVIVPDAQQANFGADDLAANRLYTTISRATQHVCILSNGPMTSLLSSVE